MKKPNVRKSLAILHALLMGGLVIMIVFAPPLVAEAGMMGRLN